MLNEDGQPLYEGYCIDLMQRLSEVRRKFKSKFCDCHFITLLNAKKIRHRVRERGLLYIVRDLFSFFTWSGYNVLER